MKSDYLTSKPAFYALFVFSLPIIIGNLFQQLYTMVDSAVVGRFVGEQALAAVGASYSLTVVFICVAIGGGVGSSVIVSKYFGARNFSAMKTAVSTAFLTFLGISVFLGAVGIVINRPLLVLLKTPSDALDMALVYLRIYFLGLPFLFMYNVISSMFNAIGNSRIPLVFLIFSSVLNVALDFLFVAVFKTGVAGAAWATLIAQGLSCVLSFAVFMRTLGKFKDSEDGVSAAEETSDGALLMSGGVSFCGGSLTRGGYRKFRFFDGENRDSFYITAVHRFYRDDAGSVRGEQFRLGSACRIFCVQPHCVDCDCSYGGVEQFNVILHGAKYRGRKTGARCKRLPCGESYGRVFCGNALPVH